MRRKETAITLKDVATAAGVSVSTASSVLSGAPSNTRVSSETRSRIVQASASLGYRANGLAKSLRRGTADLIGVYLGCKMDAINGMYLSDLLTGIQRSCMELGKDLVVINGLAGRDEDEFLDSMISGRLDGLVLHPPQDDPLTKKLVESGFPVIAANNLVDDCPGVQVDDEGGMKLLLELLYESGRRSILYRHAGFEVSSTTARLRAVESFVQEKGMTLTVTGPYLPEDGREVEDDELSEEVKDILRGSNRPDAVVCFHDHSAYMVKAFCDAEGISIPEQLAVTGFNGRIPPVPLAYRLTTVEAPYPAAGARAVELLFDLIAGRTIPQRTVLPVRLIRGDTA